MQVTITAAQRAALYDRIVDRMSGIGDLWVAVDSGDYDTAERLGREYSDELRLILDGLGWGDGPGGAAVELLAPAEVLRRVFVRFAESAQGEREALAETWAEGRRLEERNRLVGEACEAVLHSLDGDR